MLSMKRWTAHVVMGWSSSEPGPNPNRTIPNLKIRFGFGDLPQTGPLVRFAVQQISEPCERVLNRFEPEPEIFSHCKYLSIMKYIF